MTRLRRLRSKPPLSRPRVGSRFVGAKAVGAGWNRAFGQDGCGAAHGFHQSRAPGKELWLLVEWPKQSSEPSKYFLCDLPATSTLRRLVQVTKARWPIEQNYQQLKEELGLDHYEGRSWNGWHHHVTLVMLAHALLTLETLRNKKTGG